MFVISAFADEISLVFEKQVQGLQKNAIGYIELRNIDHCNVADLSDEHLAVVKKQLMQSGIQVSAIGSPLGKISADCDLTEYMKKVERVCCIANVLACENIRIFSFYKPVDMPADSYKSVVFNELEHMLEIAEKYNVKLCLENEAGLYGESPENCAEILNCFSGALRCVFDMGNFRLQGYDPYPHAYNLLKNYIEYFHIKDGFDHGAIVPPGCGEAKIRQILAAYKQEFDRDCFVSIEPHLVTFEGLDKLTEQEVCHQYVYQTTDEAFSDAVKKFRALNV